MTGFKMDNATLFSGFPQHPTSFCSDQVIRPKPIQHLGDGFINLQIYTKLLST